MAKQIMVKTKEKEEFFYGSDIEAQVNDSGDLWIKEGESGLGTFPSGSWEYVRKLK